MNLVNRFKFVQPQLSILLMGTVKIVPGNLNIYLVSKIVILVSITHAGGSQMLYGENRGSNPTERKTRQETEASDMTACDLPS